MDFWCSFVLKTYREVQSPSIPGRWITLSLIHVCVSRWAFVFPMNSLPLLFCASASSSELEPEPMDELSWLSGGQVRNPSPDSEREGVSVSDRILSRLFGLINFLIFKVIQLPRLQTGQMRQEVRRRTIRTRGRRK